MTTPRTPDDGRNERQRLRDDEDARKERAVDDGRNERQRQKAGSDDERRDLLEDKPFDFIERTKPEDKLTGTSHQGQQTRDNVNPAIPSAEPGTGGIVDPKSLGMESTAGVAPPAAERQVEQWPSLGLDHTKDAQDQVQEAEGRQRQAQQQTAAGQQAVTATDLANHLPSINEPPGSNITTGDAGPVELPPLDLTDISPDTAVIGTGTLALTVTGSGFTPATVVVFDDVDAPTTFVSPTELTADVPVSDVAEVVDVEVSRGEDMSDVLTFEFTAVQEDATATKRERKPERKPKKDTPASKRQKKDKSKGRK